CLAVQPDGKLLLGGQFSQVGGQTRNYIARLNVDGTVDADFNPGGNGTVYSLAVQPDGKVLVGGLFTQVGGQARNRIARLRVPEAALQTLEVGADRASVQWRRSGSGPELYRVWFERSDNGSAWTALGEATRITGGWSLDGLTLPRNQNLWLRARGMANNGYSAASVSLIESVRLVYMAETHVVTATVQSGQGGVTPLTQSVEPGQEAQFSVTPDPGWHVASVTGDTCTPVDQGGGIWVAPDIQATCAVAVTFEQNPPPTATPQSVSVAFNTAQTITLDGGDPNPGGPFTLTYAVIDAPAQGTIDGFDAAAGTLTYTPTPGYSGSDSFTFTVTTINGISTPATVSLTIENGQPLVAAPQSVSVPFNTAQAITLTGNDPNPGGPHALTFELVDGPSNGAISGFDAAAGTLIYTPSLGYSGTDALTFTIATINGTSGLALVRLTVEDGQAVVANPQNVNVGFNTTQTITLVGTDANPGGPHALTFALLDAPTHGTIHAFDGAAGTLTYTPAPAYFGADAFTFTVTTINGISLPATVSVTVVAPQLALSIDDSRDYARYGQMVDYVITLTNTGDTANAVPVEFSLSSGFDGDYARLTCIGADGGTLCAQDSGNPLRFMVTLPAGRTLNWLVSVPVRADAEATRVEISVSATVATPVIDANTLVLYRDGFDAPYGDGTHSAAVILGAQAREILTSDTLHELTLPAALPATPKALLIVRDADQALRVEACRVGNLVWVRLLQRDVHGYEHATAWTEAPIGAVLVLGSVATDDESRTIVLLGADSPVVLQ
ncbi:MAG: Ig-like domain-containing protein, partial [Dokdonella sp.]